MILVVAMAYRVTRLAPGCSWSAFAIGCSAKKTAIHKKKGGGGGGGKPLELERVFFVRSQKYSNWPFCNKLIHWVL